MTDEHARFWDILSNMTVCMVTTEDDDVFRSRPMAPFIDAEKRTIHFVTDNDSAKIFELQEVPRVALNFANTSDMIFASVSGQARISENRALIHKLWGPYCDVFFGGRPNDADVAVIEVKPSQAEYWDNDKNKIAIAVEMTRAYFSDDGPNLGENAKLSLSED